MIQPLHDPRLLALAGDLLTYTWASHDHFNRHVTFLLRFLRHGILAEVKEQMTPHGTNMGWLRAYIAANWALSVADNSPRWLELCLAALPEIVPDYPLDNYRALEAVGKLDELMACFDHDERGQIVACHSIYHGKYMVIETKGYAFGRADESVFWPARATSPIEAFFSFEAALAYELSPRFADALYTLIARGL